MIFAHLRREGVDITLSTPCAGIIGYGLKEYKSSVWPHLVSIHVGRNVFSKKKANRGPRGPEIERFLPKIDAARSVKLGSA